MEDICHLYPSCRLSKYDINSLGDLIGTEQLCPDLPPVLMERIEGLEPISVQLGRLTAHLVLTRINSDRISPTHYPRKGIGVSLWFNTVHLVKMV